MFVPFFIRFMNLSGLKNFVSTTPALVPDVLQQIFSLLTLPPTADNSDCVELGSYNRCAYHTLFSCLLVNRQWCEQAISVLWREPLNVRDHRGYEIIHVYMSCLDNSDRQKLANYGIKIPSFDKPPMFN